MPGLMEKEKKGHKDAKFTSTDEPASVTTVAGCPRPPWHRLTSRSGRRSQALGGASEEALEWWGDGSLHLGSVDIRAE